VSVWWLILDSVQFTLMLVAGFIVLVRHRHRSRKATGLGLIALCGFAGWWLLGLVLWAVWSIWRDRFSDDEVLATIRIYSMMRQIWFSGCVLLLVIAVVIDRRNRERDEEVR